MALQPQPRTPDRRAQPEQVRQDGWLLLPHGCRVCGQRHSLHHQPGLGLSEVRDTQLRRLPSHQQDDDRRGPHRRLRSRRIHLAGRDRRLEDRRQRLRLRRVRVHHIGLRPGRTHAFPYARPKGRVSRPLGREGIGTGNAERPRGDRVRRQRQPLRRRQPEQPRPSLHQNRRVPQGVGFTRQLRGRVPPALGHHHRPRGRRIRSRLAGETTACRSSPPTAST